MAGIRYELAHFVASYGNAKDLPEPTTPEVSFVGRSNVGKSSLLNKIVGRKALAKVSSTPGRTANINFFEADGLMLVDLPGYGYAKVNTKERERWANLISDYFAQERSFNLVVSLVDIRHEAQKLDQQMLAFLQENEFPFVVALTKADKLSKMKLKEHIRAIAADLYLGVENLLATSAETGYGKTDVLQKIKDVIELSAQPKEDFDDENDEETESEGVE